MALRKLECFSESIDPVSLYAISAKLPNSCAKLSAPNTEQLLMQLVGALLLRKCICPMFFCSKFSCVLTGDAAVRQIAYVTEQESSDT